MMTFRPLNLAAPWLDMPPIGVIFLRNVLVYFDLETRKGILARARQVLLPDGFLFLGYAEAAPNLNETFERVRAGNFVCYKPKG